MTQLIRGLHNLVEPLRGSVVTLGNFDGVHLGHQQLLAEVKRQAAELGVPSVVITFEPQPKEFFVQGERVPRLMRLSEKYLAVAKADCDYLLCLTFNDMLAGLSAHHFVEDILVRRLGMRGVVIGSDFRFGAKRQGDFALLQTLGRTHGFTATQISPVLFEHAPISSTRVRLALQQGELALAAKLLGRPFCLRGKVAWGQLRSREFGLPTANVLLHRRAVPLRGVFAIEAQVGSHTYRGVAHVGRHPFHYASQVLLVVHFFEFNQSLYGSTLEVSFLQKLRDEMEFESLDQSLQQMRQDVIAAMEYWCDVSK